MTIMTKIMSPSWSEDLSELSFVDFLREIRKVSSALAADTNGLKSALKASSRTSSYSWVRASKPKKTVRFAEPLVGLRSALKVPSAKRLKKQVRFEDQLEGAPKGASSRAVQKADLEALESEASPLKDQRRQERRKALMREIKADEKAEQRRADQLARRLVRESITKERREQRERQRAAEKLTKALLRQPTRTTTTTPKATTTTTSTSRATSYTPSFGARHQRGATLKERLQQDPDFKATLSAAAPAAIRMSLRPKPATVVAESTTPPMTPPRVSSAAVERPNPFDVGKITDAERQRMTTFEGLDIPMVRLVPPTPTKEELLRLETGEEDESLDDEDEDERSKASYQDPNYLSPFYTPTVRAPKARARRTSARFQKVTPQVEVEHPMVRRSRVVTEDKEDVEDTTSEVKKVPELNPLQLSLLGGPLAYLVNHPSAPAVPNGATTAIVAPVVRRSTRLQQKQGWRTGKGKENLKR